MPNVAVDIPFADYHAATLALDQRVLFESEDETRAIAEAVQARAAIPATGIITGAFSFQQSGAVLPSSGIVNFSWALDVPDAKKPETAQLVRAADAARRAAATADVVPTAMYAHWWNLRNSTLSEGVFKELVTAAMSAERVLGQFAPLSGKSLETFLSLWGAVKDVAAEPVVSVTPNGCIVAEWYEDDDNSLAVLATDGQDLHYSLFEDGVITEGSTTRAQIPALVANMRGRAQDPFTRSDA